MKNQVPFSPIRNDQRFKATDRALVLIDHGPESLLHHIIDISLGGLSFRYLGKQIKRTTKTINLYHDSQLIVAKIPIKTISDYRMRDSLVPVRRGSVHFDNMPENKLKQLEHYIDNIAVGKLPVAS
jgi:hypothetical protein